MPIPERFAFIVELDNPGVSEQEMREYIDEAVSTWKGQEHPDAPIRDLDVNSVRVRNYHRVHPNAA